MASPAAAGGSPWKFDAENYQPGDRAFAWAPVSWEHSDDLGSPEDGPYFAYISQMPPGGLEPPTMPHDAVRVARVNISLEPYDAGGVLLGPHHASIDFKVPKLPPGVYSVWHCNSPCTTTLGDIVPATFTVGRVGPSLGASGADASAQNGRWTLIRKQDAGLEALDSFNAVAASRDALLLAGERAVENDRWRAKIWRSTDAFQWTETEHPSVAGVLSAIAVDGETALAIGSRAGLGTSDFVWRSDDGGVTWTTAADGNDLFGTPAPEMGRPNVDGLLRHRGWWVASGGRSDGYAAIWVSRDGTKWRQVLGGNSAGAATVVKGPDGSLVAYWSTTIWTAKNPTDWSAPETASVPDRFYLMSIASGATVAVGDNVDLHGQPTPLLRSPDGGFTWTEDQSFLDEFPRAAVWTLARSDKHWIAAGWSENHVDAWVSTDQRHWTALPQDLHGGEGGTLSLVAVLDRRIVLIGTAPELDRYYTYDLAHSMQPQSTSA